MYCGGGGVRRRDQPSGPLAGYGNPHTRPHPHLQPCRLSKVSSLPERSPDDAGNVRHKVFPGCGRNRFIPSGSSLQRWSLSAPSSRKRAPDLAAKAVSGTPASARHTNRSRLGEPPATWARNGCRNRRSRKVGTADSRPDLAARRTCEAPMVGHGSWPDRLPAPDSETAAGVSKQEQRR